MFKKTSYNKINNGDCCTFGVRVFTFRQTVWQNAYLYGFKAFPWIRGCYSLFIMLLRFSLYGLLKVFPIKYRDLIFRNLVAPVHIVADAFSKMCFLQSLFRFSGFSRLRLHIPAPVGEKQPLKKCRCAVRDLETS